MSIIPFDQALPATTSALSQRFLAMNNNLELQHDHR